MRHNNNPNFDNKQRYIPYEMVLFILVGIGANLQDNSNDKSFKSISVHFRRINCLILTHIPRPFQ